MSDDKVIQFPGPKDEPSSIQEHIDGMKKLFEGGEVEGIVSVIYMKGHAKVWVTEVDLRGVAYSVALLQAGLLERV